MKRLGLALAVLLTARALVAATLDDARTALADRRYADAAKILGRLKLEADDHRLYLLANAHHLDGKHDEAIAALDTLLSKYPKSSWRSKALFKRADALAKLGRFDEAERIYEAQIGRLASKERRGEIAKVYLTHADQAFEPKLHGERPGAAELMEQKPNYKGALKLYQRAAELDAIPGEADRIALRIGLCQLHLKQHDQAIKQFDAFLKEHEKSKLVPDALYHQGLAYIGKKDPDRGRAAFEKLLRDHPDSERAPEAQYKIATTYGLPKPRSEGDLNLGAKALRQFVKLYPAHKLAPKAGYEIGQSFLNFGQHEKAIEELTAFVKAFAKKKDAVEVGRAAYLIGQAHRNLNRFQEAVKAWQAYLRQFPAHEDWQRAQAAIVSAHYDHAAWLYGKKQWDAATKAFADFAAAYPLDGRNAQALYMLGQIPYKQEKWPDAVTAWRRVVAKFPKHKWGHGAQFRIAGTLDRKLKEFEKAIAEYKKIKQGPHASAAAQRLQELKDPSLLVTYERIFRTNEKPALKVETRNIEKLHFKAYRLNAEDYFRRMGGLERIEQLDIALIDPHDEWDIDIKGYKKYEDIESQLELKLEGAGLFAINVSTDKLEATAMVLVTDLAILVKSSKKDVFVFAQNLRTGKPQPDAQLLISDGKRVVLEGTTGKDGVYQGVSDDLKKVARARVYAVADDSPASNALNLRGLGVALGLQPRGILYTDRPAYRPGGKVSYRGLIRLVDKGSYAVGEGKEATVRVHSARGDVVHEAKHKLSAFGSLAGELTLNPREPLGDYRIVATIELGDEKKHTFTGQFKVDEYQLPLYKVAFDLAKPTFFRGEKITGKIRVEYYFGHPVPDKTVRYRLKDQRWHTATTDDKGEIAVEFETDFFRQTEVLPLVAVLPADGVVSSKNVLLVTQEYQAQVTTLRGTYLVGEGFDAKVKTTDYDNKPVAREVTVGLYRYVGEDAEPEPLLQADANNNNDVIVVKVPTGYVKVATKTVTTSQETGDAVVQLTGKEGGRHLIRVEGLDTKKNLVVVQRPVFVSGEDDKIKLRILSDSDEFRVGESPELNVVCRVGPALGLITWEGERVHRYKLVPLKKGSNRIPIDIADECVPNFNLRAAVLHENEFHTATKALAVIRMLKVVLEPSQKEMAPGEAITVKITTTDQAGKPVEAEVSLAVVDEALYARYADSLPKLSDLFFQRRSGRFFVAGASNGFKHKARTRGVSKALRREEERIANLHLARLELEGIRDFNTTNPQIEAGFLHGGDNNMDDFAPVPQAAPPQNRPGQQIAFPATQVTLDFNGGGGGGGQGGQHVAFGWIGGEEIRSAGSQLYYNGGTFQLHGRGPGSTQLSSYFQTLNGDSNANGAGLLILTDGNGDFGGGNLDGQRFVVPDEPDDNREGRDPRQRRGGPSMIRLRDYFPQTAYWNPAILTDKKGEANAKIVMPETTTGWRLVCRGITANHLVGETTANIVTKQPFSVALNAPAALTTGDQASVQASVRNFTKADADTAIEFSATIAGETNAKKLDRKVGAGKAHQEFIDVEAKPGAEARLKLEARAGKLADAVAKTIPIRPWGIPVRVGASGSATDSVSLELVLPADHKYVKRSLVLSVSASLPRHLIDAALRAPTGGSCTEQTIAGGLIALSGIDLLDRLGNPPAAERARLAAVVDEAVRTLALTQKKGGWTWAFESRQSRLDPFVTGYALEFLKGAEAKGFAVSKKVAEQARAQAKKLFSASNSNAEKAALLFGLSFWGDADFSYVHRLDRMHPQLDNQSLAYLVLTFLNLDRKERAAELSKALIARSSLVPLPVRPGRRGCCWMPLPDDALWRSYPIESTALAVEAIQRTTPREPKLEQAVAWLLDNRVGASWGSPRATASAVRALSTYVGAVKAEPQKYTLDVVLNGKAVRTLAADGMRATVRIEADAALLKDKNRLDLKLKGRGDFAYSVTLEGITDGIPKREGAEKLQVDRRYEGSPLLFEGVEIPRGYSTISGEYKKIENPVEELPVGKTCDVRLEIRPHERQRYLVVEDFLPAGTSIVETTIHGAFDRYELGDGRVTFYFSNPGRSRSFVVTYRLSGRFRGQYRSLPALAYSFYNPYELVVGLDGKLAVLPKDGTPKRAYVMTPDELYHLGTKHYQKDAHAEAEPLLRRLFADYRKRLRDEPYKEAAKMLLYIALARNDAKAVVDYFEVLKERYPELVVPFDKIIAVAKAYRDRGEHERAVMVFRAVAEGFYFQEGNVAGVLEEAGDFIAASEFLDRLLAEYPDLPVVQTGLYTLAQQVYQKLPALETDEKLRKRVTKEELLKTTRALLGRFLALYPDSPVADEVSFTLASSYLEDELYPKAIALCAQLQKRYPKSPLLDSFEYIAGYGYFVTDKPDEALGLCRRVAAGKYATREGTMALSDDRFNAMHMIAQIFHAQREHDKAIDEYEKVKTHFADARKALAFLRRRHLALPEVTTVAPGKRPEVELTYRNIATADLKVYRVDLMTLYLLERNLSKITRINLAGIKPHVERTLELGDGKDYAEKKHALSLRDLRKPGAYLIVCKADEVECSGMLLVSEISLHVQEDPKGGRVRVTARDAGGKYTRKVYVKVIGSANEGFKSGQTDLRGVFEAGEVRGLATVIARQGDHYAFHRGQVPLMMDAKRYTIQYRNGRIVTVHTPEVVEQMKQQAQPAAQAGEQVELGNVKARLKGFQGKAARAWKEQTTTEQSGVQVDKAF